MEKMSQGHFMEMAKSTLKEDVQLKVKMLLIIGIPVLLILSTIVIYTVLPWFLIFIGLQLQPNPPRPEITYGEFPFRLVYLINGDQDTLICEYDGIGMDEGQDKYRKWKGHLASGKEKLLLLEVDNPIALGSNRKVVKQEIYYPIGSARFYMGDIKKYEGFRPSYPDASYFEIYEDGSTSSGVIYADELLKKYNIKLLSWDYTQPIKNSFPTSKS